jgi:cobalt transporter subunit CbtA
MISRVLATGLLAGLVAGLCVAVLQTVTTTPLILQAEVFEKADEQNAHGASLHVGRQPGEARLILVHSIEHHGGAAAAGEEGEWEPQNGLERTLYASTATVATAIGFAFLLLAGMLVAGDRLDERNAIGWAAAGFVATGLAPCAGLSPDVPGLLAADLASRQQWWIATAAATAVALWLFVRSDNTGLRLLAVPIVLAPHVWGAPQLAGEHASSVPAHLAAQFVAMSLAVQATLWLLTGFFVGFVWRRMGAVHDTQPA